MGRRMFFPENDLPEARVSLGGVTVLARIHDISETGLGVALPSGAAPAALEEAAELTLLSPTAPELRHLVVKRLRHEPDGAVFAVLLTDDERDRAVLWQLIEGFAQGRIQASQHSVHLLPSELPKIPGRGVYTEEARLGRLDWLRTETGSLLTTMQATRLDAERLSSNIENMIGSVEIPVGIAGPLQFRGHDARDIVYAPMATTEGALVASCTRGATAISRSGGVMTRVVSQRMMRVPLFVLSSLRGAMTFASWIRDHVARLRIEIRKVSNHARLISVEPSIMGNMVHVNFLYETGDAAGQNMTTACTWHACKWIVAQMKFFKEFEIDNFYIEANMSGDKKVTFQSFIAGRGIRVVAEAEITTEVLAQILKCTPDELAMANAGMLAGSVGVGMIGYNVNVANVVAAMFAATGQDIACVHECSLAQLHIEKSETGIYASMVMPTLIVGTVGGGTHLPTQRALLQMMGCAGAGKVGRLAEIVAGFCLALDLSTLAANASGHFATAHERLGRNRPVRWLERADLSPAFFQEGLRRRLEDPSLTVRAVEELRVPVGSSIVTELTGRAVSKLVGLFPMRLEVERGGGASEPLDVMVKVKPLDEEVIIMVNRLATMCGPRVAMAHEKHRARTGFRGCHVRELAIYAQTDPRFVRHVPHVYGIFQDDTREAYVLVLEYLKDVVLLDAADSPERWTPAHIEAVLRDVADLHAIWLGRERALLAQPWIGEPHTTASMVELRDLWDAIASHAATEFPELFPLERVGAAELIAN